MTKAKGPNKKIGETGLSVSGSPCTPFDDRRKAEWLAVLRQTGQRTTANIKIGVHNNTISKHLKEDELFRQAFEEALLQFRESLVSEAVRRGVQGVDEPVFSRGMRAMDIHPEDVDKLATERRVIPASIRRFSDSLLLALLKAHVPSFTDKQIVQTQSAEDAITGDLKDCTEEELELLQAFLVKVKERKEKNAEGTAPDVS
jgi:hypothetical protein